MKPCTKHPHAKIVQYGNRRICQECNRVYGRINGEFARVKQFVKRFGYLEGLEQ